MTWQCLRAVRDGKCVEIRTSAYESEICRQDIDEQVIPSPMSNRRIWKRNEIGIPAGETGILLFGASRGMSGK